MTIKIKKQTLLGICGLLSISLGFSLITDLLESVSSQGLRGYIFLGVFLISTVLFIVYLVELKERYKIVDEVVEEMREEYERKFGLSGLGDFSEELRIRLERKIQENSFTLFKFK